MQEFFKSSLLLHITFWFSIDFYANKFKGSDSPLSYTGAATLKSLGKAALTVSISQGICQHTAMWTSVADK